MATTRKGKGLHSPLMSKYRALQRKKKSYCAGRATKADVKRAEKQYVALAVSKGQTKTEAERKAAKVLKAGCSMTSNIAGRKRKATPRKKTTTTTTRRRTSAASTTRRRARA